MTTMINTLRKNCLITPIPTQKTGTRYLPLLKLMHEAKYVDPDLNGMILEDVDSDIVNNLRK